MDGIKTKAFPVMPAWPPLAAAMQSCAFILAVNWVFQGMRGMQAKELSFRLLLEAAVALGLATAGLPLLAALLAAHTASFLANGQVWVCARYCRLYKGDGDRLDRFMAATAATLRAAPWLAEAACIGSRGRRAGPARARSDIDLRLIFPAGLAGWLRTNLLLLRLRCRALVRRVPLDLYAYDTPEALARFDQEEPLLLILDRQGRLRRRYAGRAVGPQP